MTLYDAVASRFYAIEDAAPDIDWRRLLDDEIRHATVWLEVAKNAIEGEPLYDASARTMADAAESMRARAVRRIDEAIEGAGR